MSQNISSAVMAQRQEPPDSLDDFPTQPFAVRQLIEVVLQPMGLVERNQVVWEPAANRGHMVRVLREYFDTVHASDVLDYGVGFPVFDFLSLEAGQLGPGMPFGDVDWVITNPPFGPASAPRLLRFALTALQFARVGIAMFGRIQMLEGGKRFDAVWRPYARQAFYVQHVERVPLHKGRLLDPSKEYWDEDSGRMKRPSSATSYGWMVVSRKDLPPALPDMGVDSVPVVFIPPSRAKFERPGDYR